LVRLVGAGWTDDEIIDEADRYLENGLSLRFRREIADRLAELRGARAAGVIPYKAARGPAHIVTREDVLAAKSRLEAKELPAGYASIAKELGCSVITVRRRLGVSK
jgi:hypothetical protein